MVQLPCIVGRVVVSEAVRAGLAIIEDKTQSCLQRRLASSDRARLIVRLRLMTSAATSQLNFF